MEKIDLFKKELMLRRYGARTIQSYSSCLGLIISKYGDNPSTDNLKDYLITIKNRDYHKQFVATIHHYFNLVIKLPISLKDIPYPRKEYKLPVVLSQKEMKLLIDFPKNLKHQAIIYTLYSTGMRISELLNFKPEHIDRSRMVINILNAKGNKDRTVTLSIKLLSLLEKYYKTYNPKIYMFNGQLKIQYTESSVNQMLKYWSKKAGIKKNVHAHIIRHSYATHLMENGVDTSIIQGLLGHSNIKTTQIYTHVSTKHIGKLLTPLDLI